MRYDKYPLIQWKGTAVAIQRPSFVTRLSCNIVSSTLGGDRELSNPTNRRISLRFERYYSPRTGGVDGECRTDGNTGAVLADRV